MLFELQDLAFDTLIKFYLKLNSKTSVLKVLKCTG